MAFRKFPIPKLPQLGPEFNWGRLRDYLTKLTEKLSDLSVDETPPEQVKDFKATAKNGGTQLNWTHVNYAERYVIYRSDNSIQLVNAIPIATVMALNPVTPGGKNILPYYNYFDVFGQLTAGNTRYYWIQAVNALGVYGPISTQVTGTDANII